MQSKAPQIQPSKPYINSEIETPCCSEIADIFEPTLFKALSDANRISILAQLAIGAKEQTVSQVAKAYELNFSVVSRHLKILKEAQILCARKEGKEVYYTVNTQQLAAALKKMAEVLERCCPPSCLLQPASPQGEPCDK